MDSIGETLKRERLHRGLNLEQVAAETKISSHYLQAMEGDQFDRLPGGLFTRSFLRQYAHLLGLDEDQAVASLPQQTETTPTVAPVRRRTYKLPNYFAHQRPNYFARLPMLVWLAMAIAGCGYLYQIWEDGSGVEAIGTLKPELRGDRRPKPDRPHRIAAPVRADSTSASPAVHAAPKEPTPGDPTPEVGAAAVRVVLAASEPVWVSVDSDGVAVYSGTLDGQQSKGFNASAKMMILIGNVGGLTVSLNGTPVALKGAHGDVRLVELTPSGSRIVPRISGPKPSENQGVADQDGRHT